MYGRVNDDDSRMTRTKFVGRALATMGRAIVDNPEHAARRTIRLLLHDLVHKASESSLAAARFTAAEHLGAMDIPRAQVLERATTCVFVFNTGDLKGTGRQRWVTAAMDRDAGLLIRAQYVLVGPEWLAPPGAGVHNEARSRKFH